MKKIFVVGAKSALAESIVPELSRGNTIITGGRQGCDVYCDVQKEVKVPDHVDVVVNFSAYFQGDSNDDFVKSVNTNVLGALNVCIAAKNASVKHIVNISTIYANLNEESKAFSIYSLTKKQGDEVAKFYCEKNSIPLTILRPSQIYGDTQTFAKHQPFFYQILDKAKAGKDITIYGAKDPKRNFINASDLGQIINLVISSTTTGIYDCPFPKNTSIAEIARIAQAVFGRGGEVIFDPTKPDIDDNTLPINIDLYEKVGYTPKVSLKEGIARMKQNMEFNI